MSRLFILVVFSCLFNSISAATPFKDCGSVLGAVLAFDVTGCTAAPCKFSKGSTYAMNLTFLAKAASKTVTVSIHGIIGGIPIPFPMNESDVCKLGVKCPVNQNDNNIASMSLPILPSYPAISLYAKIEIKAGDQNQDYTCVEFPATIISSSDHGRNLVGWKKGKLFEMLNEKV